MGGGGEGKIRGDRRGGKRVRKKKREGGRGEVREWERVGKRKGKEREVHREEGNLQCTQDHVKCLLLVLLHDSLSLPPFLTIPF